MDWQKRTPIVSLLLIVAIAAVPFVLGNGSAVTFEAFESAQAEAREYIAENPRLEVDRRGELTLGTVWLSELRETRSLSGDDSGILLPARMLARSQARLDGLVDVANAERMQTEHSWRLGVLDRRSPPANLFAHAFVHEHLIGAFMAIGIILLAGIALERVWGSVVFGLFALATIPAVAQVYLALDASSGIPWSGAAGLAAALLGAYCIRGLGGVFAVPGWVVVPVWLGLEVFVVRRLSLDHLGSMPWATVFAAFGFGALVAGVIRLTNLEGRFSEQDHQKRNETNPILTRASRLSSDGDPYQAFDLLQAAWRDNPTDNQVGEAFYSIAVEVNQPEAAADAILPIVRNCLRKGQVDAAVDHWFPLASRKCDVRIEATAAVRLGEALLDAGYPDEALFSLELALDNGASAAHATRIVNVARDLDADLARRAALVAIADPSLDPASQQELEAIAFVGAADGAEADFSAANNEESAVEPVPVSRSQLDRRVSAEHHAVETTSFPLGDDLDLSVNEDLALNAAEVRADSLSAPLADTVLDQRMTSGPTDLSDDLLSPNDPVDFSGEDSGDVLSHWNDPGAIAASDLDGELTKLNDELADEVLFEEGGLDASRGGEDFSDLDVLDFAESTDTDRTPLVDSTEEMTSPMIRASKRADAVAAGIDEDDLLNQQTVLFETPPTDNAALSSLLTAPGSGTPVRDLGLSSEMEPASAGDGGSAADDATMLMTLREVRVIDAIPVEATAASIEIDADGHGKSKLPINRIQAIAVAAVSGISSRPVLIIDCVLNWSDDIGSPMKLIRFRSDRFDPLDFVPGQKDALSALLAWVRDLQASSRASALPTQKALEGQFARFDSLESYEREVLMAKQSDAS